MELRFRRIGKTILYRQDDGWSKEVFPSINRAKAKSVELQKENGGLGLGSLRVEE